ncbi:hypothetical protein AVEN_171755-1, partial [Araneus ventricosus]
ISLLINNPIQRYDELAPFLIPGFLLNLRRNHATRTRIQFLDRRQIKIKSSSLRLAASTNSTVETSQIRLADRFYKVRLLHLDCIMYHPATSRLAGATPGLGFPFPKWRLFSFSSRRVILGKILTTHKPTL